MDFKKEIVNIISKELDINIDKIEGLIEIPKNNDIGDYTLPCYYLINYINKKPNIIAKELKEKIKGEVFNKIECVGPYLNFFINKRILAKSIIEKILLEREDYGNSSIGVGKTICINYLNTNKFDGYNNNLILEKVIGQSLYNLYKKQGYTVIKLDTIKKYSNKEMNILINKLENRNLLVESNHAKVVELKKFNMPPCILYDNRKYTYIAKEFVKLIESRRNYKYYKYIYISTIPQKIYYNQIVKVIELLDNKVSSEFVNIEVGRIKVKDEKFFSEESKRKSLERFHYSIRKRISVDKNFSKTIEDMINVFSLINYYRKNDIEISISKMSLLEMEINRVLKYIYDEINYNKERSFYINLDYNSINIDEETELIKLLGRFEDVINCAVKKGEPFIIITYIMDIIKMFREVNACFNINLLSEQDKRYKLMIRIATFQVVKNAFKLINIEV